MPRTGRLTTVPSPAATLPRPLPAFPYDAHDLDRFRELQQLAYRCAESVAAWLAPGVTER